MADAQNRELNLVRVYLKDCSIENPNAPDIYTASGETQFTLNLDVSSEQLPEDIHEVVVGVSATATLGDKTLFMIEVKEACLMRAVGFSDEDLEHLVEIWAPAQIYPFAREVVASAAAHAGFPQIVLPPVNFEQLYEQRKAARQEGTQQAPAAQGNGQ